MIIAPDKPRDEEFKILHARLIAAHCTASGPASAAPCATAVLDALANRAAT